MEGFRCRTATTADDESLKSFLLRLLSVEQKPIAALGESHENAVRRVLSEGRNYLAELEGNVIGGAQLRILDGTDTSDRPAFIMMITIDLAHRRRGFGRQFLSYLTGEARALGARHLHLNVRSTNVAAKALYAELGFSVVAESMSKPILPEDF